MKELPLFNYRKSGDARDEGIERVWNNAKPWQRRALRAVYECARVHREFIVDSVWEFLDSGVDEPHDLRAMGAPMRMAAKAGWIEPTETYRQSARVSAHRNPRRVWRSRLIEDA